MRELLAQELQLVRREVDDEQPTAGGQYAGRLANGALGIAQEVQHLVHDDRVRRVIGERQVVDVGLAHLHMRQAGALQLGARIGEHGRAQVEAEAAPEARAEQLEHAPRSRAEIDEQIERAVAERAGDGGLHVGLGDVQRADAVPIGGVGLEVGLRGCLALVLQGFGAAQVAHDQRVATVDALEDQPGKLATLPGLGEAEVHPAALRGALDQPGLGQQLQVAADARLALAQDAGEVLDVQLARRQQHEHAQARGLGHRLQRSNCCLHGQTHAASHRQSGRMI